MPALAAGAIVSAFGAPQDDGDWHHWLDALCVGLAGATTNHHIRSSVAVAKNYPMLQRKLLNYATYTAWIDLSEEEKNDVCDNIHNVLSLEATPEVHDALLQ